MELLKHQYLNYDYKQFLNDDLEKKAASQPEDLLLSFNDKSGIYSVADSDPHKKLNANNAILINTKDPIYFQQTYEKTI